MANEILTDLVNELGTNFIEYAVAVNTDRSIPDAKTGLKPVAKRILYDAYDEGFSSKKPHVKCANIVGTTMAYWHPHGDSSIYGTLVRLSQDWTLRYPLIDFHGANGSRDGDEPAASRYTEARLATIAEDGMLVGMKKGVVDTVPNYSETKDEPVTLPSYFPNLLCNPNTGIGVAMACNWAPHNLNEVAQAIFDYMDGKEPMIPGPDFPTGGLVTNKDDIPSIMRTGHGSVKLRGKYNIEGNNIIFYEIPYGVATEALMEQIGKACDDGDVEGIKHIRNESNRKKGFRLVLECEKDANLNKTIMQLFKNTDLQTSFSYNMVGLVGKTPTELNLKDCCKIYIEHNNECICRETEYDLKKTEAKLEIDKGLLKALEDIDNIITLIKASKSAADARVQLCTKYKFTEPQAQAITDMKLGKLANLEKVELNEEIEGLKAEIKHFNAVLANPLDELKVRLRAIVSKYGDARRTQLLQLAPEAETKKEVPVKEPEDVVVLISNIGAVKRVARKSFKVQKRNTVGVKTNGDIIAYSCSTNTADSLLVFTTKGKMYRLLVEKIPEGSNTSTGVLLSNLINFSEDEVPIAYTTVNGDTANSYLFFATKNGIVKKVPIEEYTNTKRSGILAIAFKEGDSLASVTLINQEEMLLVTKNSMIIKFATAGMPISSRIAQGVKGISLGEDDEVLTAIPLKNITNETNIVLVSSSGKGKQTKISEFTLQNRGGKGVICDKEKIVGACLVNSNDNILINGNKTSIVVSANDIPLLSRSSIGNILLKNNDKAISIAKI